MIGGYSACATWIGWASCVGGIGDKFRWFGTLVVVWSQDGGAGSVGLRDC